MNADALRKGKMALNVLWVVLAISFFMPDSGLASTMRLVFVVTLAAHLIEFAVFNRTLAKLGGPMSNHFLQVMLYGLFHIQLVKLEAEPAGAE